MPQLSIDVEQALQQNIVLEQRMWRGQRIGWIVIIVLVLAGLTQLVGEGLMSLAHEGNRSPLTVLFDRIEGDQDEKAPSLSH